MAGNDVTFTFNPNTEAPSEQLNINFKDLVACLRLLGAGESSPTEITGDQNDFSTVGSDSNNVGVLRLTSDASRTITGFAGGELGRFLLVFNVGSNNIVLANQSASSTAANRIITGTSANLTVGADDVVALYYDNTTARWRVYSFSDSLWG